MKYILLCIILRINIITLYILCEMYEHFIIHLECSQWQNYIFELIQEEYTFNTSLLSLLLIF